jgi:hypothetical protein
MHIIFEAVIWVAQIATHGNTEDDSSILGSIAHVSFIGHYVKQEA